MRPLLLGVGYPDDPMLSGVISAARDTDTDTLVRVALPESLADHRVTIADGRLEFDGDVVDALFFRTRPHDHFSAGFRPDDQNFADVESRAVWLAALHLDTVFVLNRLDAVLWFDDTTWSEVRRRLAEAGIPCAPLHYSNNAAGEGESWLPYGSTKLRPAPIQTLLTCVGASLTTATNVTRFALVGTRILGASPTSEVEAVSERLREFGIHLAEIVMDGEGRVVCVDCLPTATSDSQIVGAVTELFHEYLCLR